MSRNDPDFGAQGHFALTPTGVSAREEGLLFVGLEGLLDDGLQLVIPHAILDFREVSLGRGARGGGGGRGGARTSPTSGGGDGRGSRGGCGGGVHLDLHVTVGDRGRDLERPAIHVRPLDAGGLLGLGGADDTGGGIHCRADEGLGLEGKGLGVAVGVPGGGRLDGGVVLQRQEIGGEVLLIPAHGVELGLRLLLRDLAEEVGGGAEAGGLGSELGERAGGLGGLGGLCGSLGLGGFCGHGSLVGEHLGAERAHRGETTRTSARTRTASGGEGKDGGHGRGGCHEGSCSGEREGLASQDGGGGGGGAASHAGNQAGAIRDVVHEDGRGGGAGGGSSGHVGVWCVGGGKERANRGSVGLSCVLFFQLEKSQIIFFRKPKFGN